MAKMTPKSAIRPSAVGFLVTVVASVAAFVVTLTLAAVWASRLPFEPDFGTNGVNWYFAGIGLFNLIAVPALFLLAFCLVIPVRYARARKSSTQLLNGRSLVGSILVLELVVGLVLAGTTTSPIDRMILAMMFGPLLIVTSVGGSWFVCRLNAGLTSARMQT